MATGEEKIGTILLVRPCERDRATLQNILENSRWNLVEVDDSRAAQAFLARNRVHMIFYNCDEAGSDLRDFSHQITEFSPAPLLIAASRLADESLWAETLNLGGFDLLASPVDCDEARRVILSAWQSWERERQQRREFLQDPSFTEAATTFHSGMSHS
jgi:DNA-binding NtrC family response regulator